MLESVVQMSRLDRFGEVLEAEVVEAFSALLRHYCAWAVVTLDFDWSNGLSKDDDLEEVVEDNDYDWSDKKSIVLLEKSFLVEKSISLFELVRVVETGLNRMFHNRQNQFDLMMILEFGNLVVPDFGVVVVVMETSHLETSRPGKPDYGHD
jgi:hypothetical protein